MKKLSLVAATLLLASSTAAFAQDYGTAPSVIGGGAAGTASSVVGGVANGVGGVVDGVGTAVGGVVAVPAQIFQGRSAYDTPYVGTTSCSVIGGGAAGTCNSAR